jgi:hypothetical protein
MTKVQNDISEVARLFNNLQAQAEVLARQEQVPAENLLEYMKKSAHLKNLDQPHLYRWHLMQDTIAWEKQYDDKNDPESVQKAIDARISESLKYVDTSDTWTLILSESIAGPRRTITTYDARDGQVKTFVTGLSVIKLEQPAPAPALSDTLSPNDAPETCDDIVNE